MTSFAAAGEVAGRRPQRAASAGDVPGACHMGSRSTTPLIFAAVPRTGTAVHAPRRDACASQRQDGPAAELAEDGGRLLRLIGDKAYDSNKLDAALERRGIDMIAPNHSTRTVASSVATSGSSNLRRRPRPRCRSRSRARPRPRGRPRPRPRSRHRF